MSQSLPGAAAADRQLISATFGCGHTARVRRRTARLYPDACPNCRYQRSPVEAREERLQRRRAKYRQVTDEARKYGPRPTATAEQRAAQRALVVVALRRSYLDQATGDLRIIEAGPWTTVPLPVVSEHLDTLGVPHHAVLTQRSGIEMVIAAGDREKLFRWLPALGVKTAAAEARKLDATEPG